MFYFLTMQQANVKKIAVLRANALGDFIFALPALQALGETYPQAEIILLGKKWHRDFLRHRPSPISRVVIVPPAPGIGEPNNFIPNTQQLNKFFINMQKEQFDIAIQIHGGGKFSNPFTKNLEAKISIGLQTPDAIPLDKTIPYVYYQSEYLRYLEVVNLIGATTKKIVPFLISTEKDTKNLCKIYENLQTPFVVLHPGASDIRRRWSTKKFAEVGDYLAEKGFRIIVTGTDDEKYVVHELLNFMRTTALNLCNQLTLSALTSLLSLASLVIANDTGPFHLAYALGTPCIGLFWCSNMINGAPLTRRKSRPVISWMTHCPLCQQDCSSAFPFQTQTTYCKHDISFVANISIEEVLQTIDDMIGECVVTI